jgi:hypothetical protein
MKKNKYGKRYPSKSYKLKGIYFVLISSNAILYQIVNA